MQQTKRSIWLTFQRKGFHCYPDAPDDVSYLRVTHRHIFKFRVQISTGHDNRELEFHQVLNKIESWYDQGTLYLDYRSCEMMANELATLLCKEYGGIPGSPREVSIEVSEDGECGAHCTYLI